MGVPQKIKNRIIIWSIHSFPGYLFKGNKNADWRCMHLHVHSSIIYNNQDMDFTWESTEGWMDTEKCDRHTYTNGMLFSHKEEGALAICDNMDGSLAHYTKWNKSEKVNTIWSHLYVESKQTKEPSQTQKTDW